MSPAQTTNFPLRARRDDQYGWMVVQMMLEYLRDAFDRQSGKTTRGSATVPQSATTLAVAHGLGTPSYSVAAAPSVNPGGGWWLSNKTSAQFQINLAVAAPVGGVPFDWVASAV